MAAEAIRLTLSSGSAGKLTQRIPPASSLPFVAGTLELAGSSKRNGGLDSTLPGLESIQIENRSGPPRQVRVHDRVGDRDMAMLLTRALVDQVDVMTDLSVESARELPTAYSERLPFRSFPVGTGERDRTTVRDFPD